MPTGEPQTLCADTPDVNHVGADDGVRIHGLDLGKVALYQLSYIRMCEHLPGAFQRWAARGKLLKSVHMSDDLAAAGAMCCQRKLVCFAGLL